MGGFVIRRLIESIPVLLLSTVAVFMILRLLPGDQAQALAGPDARPEVLQAVRQAYGLDRPLPVQYITWLGDVVRGDFGKSFLTNRPVMEVVGRRLPVTLELAIVSLLLSCLIAFPLGITAALNVHRRADFFITVYNGIALAVPGFWLGLLGIMLFSLVLGWVPPGGRVEFSEDPWQHIKMLILPALTLSLASSAGIGRLVRTSMLEVLSEDYIRTARSKGLGQFLVVVRHGLRNALMPVVTVLGLQFGRLVGGQVITEQVFNWPGMGRLVVESITTRDYVVVQGVLLVFVVMYVFISLVIDISYALLDPRVRVAYGKGR